jgi:hypothetical protein
MVIKNIRQWIKYFCDFKQIQSAIVQAKILMHNLCLMIFFGKSLFSGPGTKTCFNVPLFHNHTQKNLGYMYCEYELHKGLKIITLKCLFYCFKRRTFATRKSNQTHVEWTSIIRFSA